MFCFSFFQGFEKKTWKRSAYVTAQKDISSYCRSFPCFLVLIFEILLEFSLMNNHFLIVLNSISLFSALPLSSSFLNYFTNFQLMILNK